MNGVVGYQLLDDGTPTSLGLLLLSGGALFVGTAYIALDTGYSWTRRFDGSLVAPNRNIALYILYQLFPLVCLVGFFILETYLVLRVLGERRPMRSFYLRWFRIGLKLTGNRIFGRRGPAVRNRTDFPIRHQHSHLPVDIRQDQRCSL